MSKYQLLLEQAAAGGENADETTKDSNASTTTNINVHAAAENLQKTLLFTDSSNDSSSSSSGSGVNGNNRVTTMRNSRNALVSTNTNNSSSSNNSLNISSSASGSWEYSPFDSLSTNNINEPRAAPMRATATETNLVATASKSSSTSLLLDAFEADDTTMEVPLLGENNNSDYHDHGSHQFTSASGNTNTAAATTTCHCQLPGFSANLRTKSTQDAKFKILLAITLCCIFMIVEFLGGYMAGSLAIMTDAAHLASDCISFVISLVAIWLGSRPPDSRMSFGYKRMEVMGAIISILGIWILTATLIMVAVQRLYSNDFDLNANTMMAISGIGILINIVMVFVLHGSTLAHGATHGHSHAHAHAHSHSHASATHNDLLQLNGSNTGGNEMKHAKKCDTAENLNLRAAMIHVIGDLIQSIGVFLASILIQFYPNAKFADPLCTVLFSFIVFMTTVRLFRESMGILLNAVPPSISLGKLEMDLINIDGVKNVHHLNVWSHTNNHYVMMVHLVIDFLSDSNTILKRVTQVACGPKYNIQHCTVQIERLTS
ncbi:proton-coupled zinc antiporter SLC30A2 [Anastrepha obliqua]|uniref:proton-coupled zinc antiporter SLC30A2 n=1 Tax=Anastrepha obliqua TaxID=95512 RepID=UPI00240A331A|nr:proton-coupled zinc antiporter SLC30A2 [Anastrepha obliqua]XP_054738514.1 proton-coupled zinc antiporter SLC30A2 [Anastrepha obliqua]XP_054738515.1 proton-coupled zinc antiporter SLC30A2 [Anastrepha obliqua]XP_054738516.1 proton-coupled zinc antiporter SLC30A2 [Anastrepha obliqua]XP_054738517.1 proton-coupled zinc antiporter SLC30A2 [Anastrepha obliqua]XP_054738518.1 proton-coupled zinc antiporter SLC30A2 [Anastrepha obliqua]XP_054738519.1 proton-coupled zinc antiporter SLC30A2 [Anastrepha